MWYNPATWTPVDAIQTMLDPNSYTYSVDSSQPTYGSLGPVSTTVAPSGSSTSTSTSSTTPSTTSSNTDSSSVLGTTQKVDPYAQWGGQTAYNNLISGINAQENNIYSSSQDAAKAFGSKYNRSILDYLDSRRIGQQGIDTQAAKNELAKIQGMNGILSMINQGVNSAGVQLANRNAGDSSASDAIARAYSQIGRNQAANIGNQYALGQQDVQTAQNNFDVQQQSGLRNLQGSKEDAINSIVSDANTQLAALDAQIANASLPGRLEIEQAKQQIRNDAVKALQSYDSQLSQGVGGIKATTADQRRAKAAEMATAGYDLGQNAFNYSTNVPVALQGTGPSSSTLPIYTYQNKDKNK